MSISVATARLFVQQYGISPSGDTSVYPLTAVDRAIQTTCDDFIEAIGGIIKTDDWDSIVGQSTITMPTGCSGYMISEIMVSHETDDSKKYPINMVSLSDLYKDRTDGVSLIRPTKAAILDSSPSPISFTIRVNSNFTYHAVGAIIWRQPLTMSATWTVGGTDATTIAATFNIPDHWLRMILVYGATAMLQHTDVEKLYANESWKKYAAFRDRLAAHRVGTPRIRQQQSSMMLEK